MFVFIYSWFDFKLEVVWFDNWRILASDHSWVVFFFFKQMQLYKSFTLLEVLSEISVLSIQHSVHCTFSKCKIKHALQTSEEIKMFRVKRVYRLTSGEI